MTFQLSDKSRQRLAGVKPELVQLVESAIATSPIDFLVVEGVRSKERQRYLFDAGKSRTMNSRHLTGDAVDLAPIIDGKVSWDWAHFHDLSDHIKTVAKSIGVAVEWGGDWVSFKDGPHWQLPR